jgi:hypothetical protein
MMSAEDDIYIDPKTTCSREEAVAKLLGWLQGTRRRPFTEITLHGISVQQLPELHTLEGSTVLDLLAEHRRATKADYVAAVAAGQPDNVIQEKRSEVVLCDAIIDKAKAYFIDFDDEAAKGAASAFRIDRAATRACRETQYTLKTVDVWTRATYGVSIANPDPVVPIVRKVDVGDESDGRKGMSKTQATNLYITFALLIEDIVNTKMGAYRHPDGRANMANVAQYIFNLAEAAGGSERLPGQSLKTLKNHIKAAIKAKGEALE